MKIALTSRPARLWIALFVLWTLPALSSAYRTFTTPRRDAHAGIPPGLAAEIQAWYLLLLAAPLLVIAARRLRLTSQIGLREVFTTWFCCRH